MKNLPPGPKSKNDGASSDKKADKKIQGMVPGTGKKKGGKR